MAKVSFTSNLLRHVACRDDEVPGDTVAAVLDGVFARQPEVRDYVLDEHGRLRTHMVVFVDGRPVRDRATLSDEVRAGSAVYVMQALSGG